MMNNKRWDTLYWNTHLATAEGSNPYGLLENAALGVKDGRIDWIGDASEVSSSDGLQTIDLKGKLITPGLIDCHTHLVYAGSRYHEFELRLQGASYEQIARAGGGIRSTVAATRLASEEELFKQSEKRARALLKSGVTTIEIKSGYGLDLETELKILRVAQRIGEELPITVFLTFLGAHTCPSEFEGRVDDYIDIVCHSMIPAVKKAGLAKAVDVFCEKIAFSTAQTRKVFEAAKEHDLAIKCHAEQLSDSGAAALAAQYGALSVDHLEFLSESGVKALAETGSVAVLLPGAFYFLREKQMPPIELLRQYKVPIAISTDCNPGTSPVTSLLLMLNMACTLFRLTPEEAFLGVTRYAARALGLEKTHGTLQIGKQADLVIWDVKHPAELAYQIGINSCVEVIKNGEMLMFEKCSI